MKIILIVVVCCVLLLASIHAWEKITKHPRLRRRKDLIGWIFLAGFGLWISFGFARQAYRNNSQNPEDKDFRRQYYMYSVIFSGLTAYGIFSITKEWKSRNKLEEHWRNLVMDREKLNDIYKNPAVYRDDFKQWINENYPHLKIWTYPPNAAN